MTSFSFTIQQFTSAPCSVVVSHSATPQYKPSLGVRFQSSTMSNSIDQLYEVLFRRTPFNTRPRQFVRLQVHQQCRTPSTRHVVTTQPFPEFNNVELHRLSKLTRPVFSLEIAVELRHGELSSCAMHTLNTCNLTSTRPSAVSDSTKSKVLESNY